jgi:hypothetical protein
MFFLCKRHARGWRSACVWMGVCWAMGCTSAWSQVQLQCEIEVNGEVHRHAFSMVSDPYSAGSVDIGERFRFKAVVLGEGDRVDLVNIYAYYQTRRQPMLMQHAKHLAPVPMRHPQPDALTGRVALYSPVLGKELAYRCALHQGLR